MNSWCLSMFPKILEEFHDSYNYLKLYILYYRYFILIVFIIFINLS